MQLDCSFFIPLQIIHVIFFLSASKQILGLLINWDIESLSSYLVIVLSPKSGGGTPQRETSGTGGYRVVLLQIQNQRPSGWHQVVLPRCGT